MSTCSNCGTELAPKDIRCPSCRKPIKALDPYAPSDALILDTAAPAPTSSDSPQEKYGIPLGAQETIAAAFRLWANSLGSLVLMALIPFAAIIPFSIIIAVFVFLTAGDLSYVAPMIVLSVIATLVVIPLSIASAAGMYLLIDDQARFGENRRGVLRAFGEGFHFLWRYIGIGFLITLISGGILVPAIIGWAVGSWPAGLLFTLAGLSGVIYLQVRWIALWAAIVIENSGAINAMSRSSALVQDRWWTVFGILALFFLIIVGISMITVLLGMIPVFGQLVGLAVNLLLNPLSIAFSFAIYAALKDLETHSGFGPKI